MSSDVIIYILLSVSLSSATRCSRSIDSISKQRLRNHVIEQTIESDHVECIQRCMKKRNCYSMNYKKADKLCEHNNGSKVLFENDMEEDDGFMYMDNPNKILNKQSCMDIKMANASAKSGNHEIKVGDKTLTVYCDMDSNGGGWTLVADINKANIQDHLQTKKHNCFSSSLCVPNNLIATRKLSDSEIHQIAGTYEGTFKLWIDYSAGYEVFYQIPSGADKFNSSCDGSKCPRIIASHFYPYQWESNCKGTELGYMIKEAHFVFDTNSIECGVWATSKGTGVPYRGLYGIVGYGGGIYDGRNGKLFVR